MQNLRPFFIAGFLGVALAYLVPLADALQVAVVQKAYMQEWLSAYPSVRTALLHLPMLSLPTLTLVYLLGILAFSTQTRMRALLLLVFLLPLLVQALWFSWSISGGSWAQAFEFSFGDRLASLSWLAIVLAAALALSRTRNRGAA